MNVNIPPHPLRKPGAPRVYIYISFISIKSYPYPSSDPSISIVSMISIISIDQSINLPNILQRSGTFCLRRLGPRSGLSPCFELGDQSTLAPCDTPSDKTHKNIFKGSWEAIFRVTNTFGTLCDVVTKEVVAYREVVT